MDDEDAAVEKQKLVADDEADNEPDDEQNISSSAPKTIQTPISPVLSNKVKLWTTVVYAHIFLRIKTNPFTDIFKRRDKQNTRLK